MEGVHPHLIHAEVEVCSGGVRRQYLRYTLLHQLQAAGVAGAEGAGGEAGFL